MDEAAMTRRNARQQWPIRVHRLGEDPAEDLAERGARELLAMVWRITRDTWAMSGAEMPTYRREQAPGRIVRLHDE